MTFHNINNQNNIIPINNPVRENMSGRFGNRQNRSVRSGNPPVQRRQRNVTNFAFPRFNNISAERWVDIICISLISIFMITVFANWNAFLDSLFFSVLFPIISAGGKILLFLGIIAAVIGCVYARIRRPRRWY